MDTEQDMEDILKLQKEIEAHPDASQQPDAIKKARVGYINLKGIYNRLPLNMCLLLDMRLALFCLFLLSKVKFIKS